MGRTGAGQVICNRALSGKRLRLSAFAKSDTLGSSIYVHLFSHTKTGFDRASSQTTVYGTMDWTRLSVEADIPQDTYEVWAWIAYSSPVPGHAYIDDASLEVLGPATGKPTSDAIMPDASAPGSTREKGRQPGKKPAKP